MICESATIRHLGYLPLGDEPARFVPGAEGRQVNAAALAVLRRHVQACGALEAGGVLLGRYTHDGGVLVDEATEPAPGDIREPRAFHRLDDAHPARVLAAWRETDGRMHYLGEWHTHSEPVPIPSDLDLESWRQTHADAQASAGGNAPTVYVIVGQRVLGMWQCW